MANTELVLFEGRTDYPIVQGSSSDTPGLDQGLYISTLPEALEDIQRMFTRWFAAREDVRLVDYGTSDKQSYGFILMEWLECKPDQLFMDILDAETGILDYTLYSREVE